MIRGRTTGDVLPHGVASRPAAGQQQCGDRAVVVAAGDATLLAVVDGLGHGAEAAAAADVAAGVVAAHASTGVADLMRRCDRALRRTRGAAISLARVAGSEVEWLAVGNVAGSLFPSGGGRATRLVTRGGVAGMRLPPLRPAAAALAAGDLLVMHTDGVRHLRSADLPPVGDPQAVAQRLLDRHAAGTDDALVLAARYPGPRR